MAFESLTERLSGVFKKLRGKGRLSEADIKAAMREVRMALLEADVNYKVAKDFCNQVSERAMGQEVMESLTPAQQVVKIVNEELTRLMGGEKPTQLHIKNKGQTVLMMCGLQGNGKTTHAAKLGKYFPQGQGRRPLLVACDIYRPAAIDQLQDGGRSRQGCPSLRWVPNSPETHRRRRRWPMPRDHGNDIVILDTAGRLQIDDALMEELSPHQAGGGGGRDPAGGRRHGRPGRRQRCPDLQRARSASTASSSPRPTAIPAAVQRSRCWPSPASPSTSRASAKSWTTWNAFYPSRMAGRILGMGDVLSLIEKAQAVQDDKEAEEAAKRMMANKFDLNDMLAQFAQIKKMGGASALLSMLPGGNQIDPDSLDEKALPHIEAIIYSMTPEERAKPSIINPKRKRRIAAGSGQTVEAVNKLLRQYEMMQKLMKQAKRNPKGFMRRLGGLRGLR